MNGVISKNLKVIPVHQFDDFSRSVAHNYWINFEKSTKNIEKTNISLQFLITSGNDYELDSNTK